MILDTSALVAVLYREPEAAEFVQLIHDAEVCRISVANYVELSMVVENQLGPEAGRQVAAFFRRAGIVIEPVTLDHGELARQAFLDFGKGRHEASLNYGDCFAYALAKATGEPLLFKGNDFSRTDISAAYGVDATLIGLCWRMGWDSNSSLNRITMQSRNFCRTTGISIRTMDRIGRADWGEAPLRPKPRARGARGNSLVSPTAKITRHN